MRIAVIYGGKSSEAAISRKSAEAIIKALKKLNYEVLPLELNKNLAYILSKEKIDLAFPILHGKPGEDGTIQGLLEILEIPYIGNTVKTSAVCMDKDFTKRILQTYNIPTPKGIVIYGKEMEKIENWKIFPAVIKPAEEGSSIGMGVASNKKELLEYLQNLLKKGFKKILIEEFLSGEEYTCGYAFGEVFTPLKIMPKKSNIQVVKNKKPVAIYDFYAKYTKGATEFYPVEKEPLATLLKEITARIVKIFEIKSFCRVDFKSNEKGEIKVLEINTIPGMTETSLLPLMARLNGYTFEDFIEKLIKKELEAKNSSPKNFIG